MSSTILLFLLAIQDGSKVISGGADNAARAFDLQSGQSSQVAQHDAPIKCVKWIESPQGSILVTGSWDKTIKVCSSFDSSILFYSSLFVVPWTCFIFLVFSSTIIDYSPSPSSHICSICVVLGSTHIESNIYCRPTWALLCNGRHLSPHGRWDCRPAHPSLQSYEPECTTSRTSDAWLAVLWFLLIDTHELLSFLVVI